LYVFVSLCLRVEALRAASGVSEADLAAWLQKGLGRAVLRLRETDARPFRRVILHACTHNLACLRDLVRRDP